MEQTTYRRPTLTSSRSDRSADGLGLTLKPSPSSERTNRFGGGSFLMTRQGSHQSSIQGFVPMDDSRPDPDELFQRMTVGEVKRVETKLRATANSKRSELRTMVGERYRDLLSSSAALSTLFVSSSKLSAGLKEMKCLSESAGDVPYADGASKRGGSVASEAGDDNIAEELAALLPLASQTKLLLDAPETLWRFLEHKQFLQAAWLFCLGRVVHLEAGESTEGPRIDLPLLHRQWEDLSQFRSQIVQRATFGLRDLGVLPTDVSQTLIAIILLDSISLPAALSVLLVQRTRLLQDLTQQSTAAAAALSTPQHKKLRITLPDSPSLINGKEIKPSSDVDVLKVLSDTVTVLGETVAMAREVFGSTTSDGKSLIVSLAEAIEKGEELEPEPAPLVPFSRSQSTHDSTEDNVSPLPSSKSNLRSTPRSKDQTHQRRASRLASISLPFSLPSPTPNRQNVSASSNAFASSSSSIPTLSKHAPVMTTPALLRMLPSSPLLLRYLPPAVKSYAPFLLPTASTSDSDPSLISASQLSSTLSTWLSQSIILLKSTLAAYASSMSTIAKVWEGRGRVKEVLSRLQGLESSELDALVAVLEDGWATRVAEICTQRTNEIAERLKSGVREKFELLNRGEKDAEGDISPPIYLFSPSIPFPSATSSLPPSTALPLFRTALRRRVAERTPLLDTILRELEALSSRFNADLDTLRIVASTDQLARKLVEAYRSRSYAALDRIVHELEGLLDVVDRGAASSIPNAIKKDAFIGRLACHLGSNNSVAQDILGGSTELPDDFSTRLSAVYARSVNRWLSKTSKSTVERLSELFSIDVLVQETLLTNSWQPSMATPNLLLPHTPSKPLLSALYLLVDSLWTFGSPQSQPNHTSLLLDAFGRELVVLPDWKTRSGKGRLQALYDVLFVKLIVCPEHSEGTAPWNTLIEEMAHSARAADALLPLGLVDQLNELATSEILRLQTMLRPLLLRIPTTLAPLTATSNGHSRASKAPSTLRPGSHVDSHRSSLLRIGVPTQATSTVDSSRSGVELVAPSQRFGLLPVASVSVR